jgi:prophage DNA circulation protein
VSGLTPQAAAIAANAIAIALAVRVTALTEAANAAASVTFDTSSDALAAMDDLTSRIDAELLASTDPTLSMTLTNLRAAVVTHLTVTAATLPDLVTIVLQEGISAAALSYRLYGSDEFGDEIAARNQIGAPALLPGGVPLEVLSSAPAA